MNEQPTTQPEKAPTSSSNTVSTVMIIGSIIPILIGIIYSYGAAKLSYSKYGSFGWAAVAFLFAPIYYPFYALFLHTPPAPATILGGLRKLKW